MSDYRRWISYIYAYENGVKKRNAGYAKLELKDGKLTMTLHVTPDNREGNYRVCLYKSQSGHREGVELGGMEKSRGGEGVCFVEDAANLSGSGLLFQEMNGLFLYDDRGKYLISSWEDEPVEIPAVQEIIELLGQGRQDMPAVEEEKPEAERKNLEKTGGGEEREPDALFRAESADHPAIPRNTEKVQPEGKMDEARSAARDAKTGEGTESVEVPAAQKEDKVEADAAQKPGKLESRVFSCLPAMYPFEHQEFERSVRMEPQDIGLLPREIWKYAGNSFLLHSYYAYHHILFVRKVRKEGRNCYLMLPGIYNSKEQHMAQLFGFPHFCPIRKKALQQDDFGYWYMEMGFPDSSHKNISPANSE